MFKFADAMKRLTTILWALQIICSATFAQESQPQMPHIDLLSRHKCEVSIMLGGDVMFHSSQVDAALRSDGEYDFSDSFKYIKDRWSSCDAVIFNFESTLATSNYSGYPQFATPKQAAQNLSDCGVTHLMLANNHICDRYGEGIKRTLRYIELSGMQSAGAYVDSVSWRQNTPLYIRRNGLKIALLNYTYGTNGIPTPKGMVVPRLDTTLMAQDIARAKSEYATNIITFLHWGNEYQQTPSAEQRKLAKWLRDKGVDIIIGSHPHVIQPTVVEPSGVTVYSLGNLISNQRQRGTNGGLLVKLHISFDTRSGEYQYHITHLPHFVYRAQLGDSPRHYCIKESQIDSIIPDEEQRAEARIFFDDTKKLLNK